MIRYQARKALVSFLFGILLFGGCCFELFAQDTKQSCPSFTVEKILRANNSDGKIGWGNGEMGWSPDGKLLAVADTLQSQIEIWDVARGITIRTISKKVAGQAQLIFSDDGKSLLTSTVNPVASGGRASLSIVNIATNEVKDVVGPFEIPQTPTMNVAHRFAVSLKTGFAATVTDVGRAYYLNLYRIGDWSLISSHPLVRENDKQLVVADVAFNPLTGELAVLDVSGLVQLWDPREGKQTKRISVFASRSRTLAFSPDGTKLATGMAGGLSMDKFEPDPMRLWDTRTWTLIASTAPNLAQESVRAWALSYSPTSDYLASFNLDGKIRLWDAGTLSLICEIDDGGKGGIKLQFSPDGLKLAIARDTDVRILALEKNR